MSLVGKDERIWNSPDGVRVPPEITWWVFLKSKYEMVCSIGTSELDTTRDDISGALVRLVQRYDLPRFWFNELRREGEKEYPLADKSRENRRRKTWAKMQRDFSIYRYRLEGKTTEEISRLILSEFGEDLDHGNIKKIVSDVRHRKLGS